MKKILWVLVLVIVLAVGGYFWFMPKSAVPTLSDVTTTTNTNAASSPSVSVADQNIPQSTAGATAGTVPTNACAYFTIDIAQKNLQTPVSLMTFPAGFNSIPSAAVAGMSEMCMYGKSGQSMGAPIATFRIDGNMSKQGFQIIIDQLKQQVGVSITETSGIGDTSVVVTKTSGAEVDFLKNGVWYTVAVMDSQGTNVSRDASEAQAIAGIIAQKLP